MQIKANNNSMIMLEILEARAENDKPKTQYVRKLFPRVGSVIMGNIGAVNGNFV